MDSYVGLSLVIIILIALSAFFSATETAYTSLNRIRIKNLAKEGNKKAKLVERLSENYDRLLSTILIGNNIVNILSSSLATVLFVGLFGNAGVTLSTVVMTILVLIFGEITPKNVARRARKNSRWPFQSLFPRSPLFAHRLIMFSVSGKSLWIGS